MGKSGCLATHGASAALSCALLQLPCHDFVLHIMGSATAALSPGPRSRITVLTLLYQAELLLWNWVPGSQYGDLMGYSQGRAAAVL